MSDKRVKYTHPQTYSSCGAFSATRPHSPLTSATDLQRRTPSRPRECSHILFGVIFFISQPVLPKDYLLSGFAPGLPFFMSFFLCDLSIVFCLNWYLEFLIKLLQFTCPLFFIFYSP